ncbi:MAG: flagellar hook basal-body protein [Alphaproteobacteria bacterium]
MISTILSGIGVAMNIIDVVSNNVANAKTTGFKRTDMTFGDVYGQAASAGKSVGSGAIALSNRQIHAQGALLQTGNSLDLAINGSGYFMLAHPDNDTDILYTRNGAFQLGADGSIVTTDGRRLLDPKGNPIKVPPVDGSGQLLGNLSIDSAGRVTGAYGNGPTMVFGQVGLAGFANVSGLTQVGMSRYQTSIASGEPVVRLAGQPGAGTILSGQLEQSNTDVTRELTTLLRAQQSFGANSRMLQTEKSLADRFLR